MVRKCRKRSQYKQIFIVQTAEDSEKKCRECWEYNVQTGKEGGSIE
jgi:uncharacterized protein Veg